MMRGSVVLIRTAEKSRSHTSPSGLVWLLDIVFSYLFDHRVYLQITEIPEYEKVSAEDVLRDVISVKSRASVLYFTKAVCHICRPNPAPIIPLHPIRASPVLISLIVEGGSSSDSAIEVLNAHTHSSRRIRAFLPVLSSNVFTVPRLFR